LLFNACREADVLGVDVDTKSGCGNGFFERYRASYTVYGIQGELHGHHSVQRLSLYLRQNRNVHIIFALSQQ